MRKAIILGNCLGERLALLLQAILARWNQGAPANRQWELVKIPPVYNLQGTSFTLESIRDLVSQCNVVFSQPLFNFGPLNTEELKKIAGIKLHTFSAPNFDAYFPDIVHAGSLKKTEKFPPPLEWHSRIFLEFKAASLDAIELEKFYFNHPLFQNKNMAIALDKSWTIYEQREKNVEIGTLDAVRKYYASEILFYTWKHPADRIIRILLEGILAHMDFSNANIENIMSRMPFQESIDQPDIWSHWGFGFNAWPVLRRKNKFFNFPGREFFRIHGQKLDILTAALLWFQYYDQHPDIFAALLRQAFAHN